MARLDELLELLKHLSQLLPLVSTIAATESLNTVAVNIPEVLLVGHALAAATVESLSPIAATESLYIQVV